MKHLVLLVLFILAVPLVIFAQYSETIESFDAALDSAYFRHEINENADTTKSFVDVSLATDEVAMGDGAMRLEYGAHNAESWGGYAKIEHILPGSEVYDWSAWDSISFWYYNEVPQSLVGRINLRFELYEVSDVPDTTSSASQMEFYYSFHYVLDNPAGWNEIKMPLVDGRGNPDLDEWNGEAFNRTGWAGVTGNDQLNTDKIKGWSFEFSISGAGEGDESHGTIIIDQLSLKGFGGKSLVIFDGMKMPPAVGSPWTWGQSAIELVEGEGYIEGSNALKWTQGDEYGNGWTGFGWNIPAIDLQKEWAVDSLRFKMKAELGTGPIRAQFEDGTAKVGSVFSPVEDDGEWHTYALALKDFVYEDGTSNLDTTALTVFGIMAEASASAGRVVLFDEIWTGDPVIDVIAPAAPQGVSATPGDKFNVVIWQDVPGEEGETYSVYASESPISDLTAAGVDLIASGIAESESAGNTTQHNLKYPLAEKQLTYYYAVTCSDKAGNVSVAGVSSSGTTNTAAASPTISLELPADLVIDGDIGEWLDSDIMPFELIPSEGAHVAVGAVDDDADLTATFYLAVDDDYLYGAFDVIDNIYSWTEGGDAWQDDMIEMFIGLYNQSSLHKAFLRGSEPDYQLYMLADKFTIQNPGTGNDLANPVMLNADENYEFVNFGASDWAVEFKLSLDTLAERTGDDRFHAVNGMKIPLDIVFQDTDSPNTRDGGLSLSPINNDNSYQSPANWTFTWIGDTNRVAATAIDDERNLTVSSFSLGQNYPNPFNPSTTIEYSLAKASQVNIAVYNTAGQKVVTLVNTKQNAGAHMAKFNAQNLSSGVYFYQIKAGDFVQTKKMLLVK
jgi:hypothetical protein